MKKHILCRICLAFLCVLLCCPLQAMAVNLNEACSLTLHYKEQDRGLEGLEIHLYRVGEVFADGKYALVQPYEDYPVDIQGEMPVEEWKNIAATLQAYISADRLKPDFTKITDEEGTVEFAGLKTGLYLVSGVTCETETSTCLFDDFLMFLPRQNGEKLEYHVEAQPKFSQYVTKEETTEYSVRKLWKDEGSKNKRPVSVSVDILKNGEVQKNVELSADNYWYYSWSAPVGDRWSVVERQVPEGYTVTVSGDEMTFVITNTYKTEEPGDPGKVPTGDTAPILLYILLTCLSGFCLVILGIAVLRGKQHDKKR